MAQLLLVSVMTLAAAASAFAAGKTDPTFLRRSVASLAPQPSDLTTPSCSYKPVFGAGDADAKIVRSVARFGEVSLQPGGKSAPVAYPREEQVYFVLDGAGALDASGQPVAFKKNDFLYVPPGTRQTLSCGPAACRILLMGFRIPQSVTLATPAKVQIANIAEVPKQVVGSHPPSTLYQLLIGTTDSKRDRIAAAHVLTSLFIMEFAAGGTNQPHHHEEEEEIYYVLDGHGEMVAGGGMDGIEGRFPAKAGDAYFFRLNTTVGFYAGNKEGEPKAHILALRSLFPFRNR